MECYKIKEFHNNNNEIIINEVDATYVIHLENNGRYNDIINQLNNYKLTNKTYILFNKGFKYCEKEKHITKSNLDLVDTYYEIFKHSKMNNYNNILILEDEFILSNDIIKHNYNINNFIKIIMILFII